MRSAWNWLTNTRAALVALWVLFVLPRAAALLIAPLPTSDADWYYSRGAMLAAGIGYLGNNGAPTAYWPPGWPMALSAAFRLLGTSVWSVGLLNLACAALSGWLLYDLARRITGTEGAGRVALLLYAIYPNAIGYVPLALTEVFYTTLLLAICWLLVARTGRAAFVLAGLLLGMATLVKAQTLVVVPLILAIELLRAPGFWRRLPAALGQFALLVALAGVVVAPWTMRNQRVLGHTVLVSTNGGITLYTGNNDSARGGFTPEDAGVKALETRSDLDEVAYDAEAKRRGVEWIKAHPARFAALMPLKLAKLWTTDGEAQWAYETGLAGYARWDGAFHAVRIANQLYYLVLLAAFAAAAALQLVRRWRGRERLVDWWLLPVGIAAYPSAIAMVFSGQSRFHFPAMPFVCIGAAWLIADIAARRRARARDANDCETAPLSLSAAP